MTKDALTDVRASAIRTDEFESVLSVGAFSIKSDSRYKRPFSPATVNRYLQVLSRVLSMAYENGIVDSNPMSRVKRLREPEPRQRYLNQYADDEEERLMKAQMRANLLKRLRFEAL